MNSTPCSVITTPRLSSDSTTASTFLLWPLAVGWVSGVSALSASAVATARHQLPRALACPNSDIRWCDFREGSNRGTTVRSLIVVTSSASPQLRPSPACSTPTANSPAPRAGMVIALATRLRMMTMSPRPRSEKNIWKPCSYDDDCRPGSHCIKGSGREGVCIEPD